MEQNMDWMEIEARLIILNLQVIVSFTAKRLGMRIPGCIKTNTWPPAMVPENQG